MKLHQNEIIFFKERLEKLRKRLIENNAGGIIIFKEENIYYLTGFYAKNSGSALIVTEKELFLIVHFIYFEKAKKSVVLEELNLIEFKSKIIEKFKEVLEHSSEKGFGIESNYVSYDSYVKYRDALKKMGKELINLPGFIEQQRLTKDEFELKAIKKSCKIIDDVINNIISMDPGKITGFSEINIALLLEEMMIKMGASSKSFDLIVANNALSSLPHYEPSHNIIKEGLLLFDIGCVYENYCSDITRTFFINKKMHRNNKDYLNINNDRIKEIYDIVLQSQMLALQSCRAGITCRELDSVARDFIEKKGYGKYFGHGLGYGVGLEVHENPRVSYNDDTILEENMVITIEPGIYIEGIGGVRIEDMVIVKNNACINLYNSPKNVTLIGGQVIYDNNK